jgi:signal transduction histidine kinase
MRFPWGDSLTSRLLLLLILVQSLVPILGMAAWMLFSPFVSWTDVAAASARRVVASSLVPGASNGSMMIEATPELRTYSARRPGFVYAVMNKGQVVEGSDSELAAALRRLAPYLPAQGQLAIPLPGGTATALFDTDEDAAPGLTFVTAGNAFHAEDFGGYIRSFLPALIPIFGPSLLVAAIAVPLVVRSAMAPLRAAAAEAGRIEFNSMSHRLSDARVPSEAAPLVKAVNAALERLSDGAERQRLFHANAAHELRTPVAILQARLDAMPELARGHELRRDVNRIALLVEQLLAVERFGAGGAQMEPVELIARVRSLVADCAPLAIRSGRTLEFEHEVATATVKGNGRALDSAIANLIDNALRAEPQGGCVTVRVRRGPVVEVVDHGAGVEAADRALVFEPFWRKDERPPGSGLGLSIVREVARLHGGEVSVYETPGGGATFRIALLTSGAATLLACKDERGRAAIL